MLRRSRRGVRALLEALDSRTLFDTLPGIPVDPIDPIVPTVDLTPGTISGPDAPVYPGGGIFMDAMPRASEHFPAGVRVAYFLSADDVAGNADDIPMGSNNRSVRGPGEYLIDAGGIALFTVPAGVAPGTYRLGVTVDPLDAVPETDETNNSALGPSVTVVAPPPQDLTLGTLTWAAPPNLYTDFPIGGFALVGAIAPLPNSIDVRYALSTDEIVGNADDIELGTVPEWANPLDVVIVDFSPNGSWPVGVHLVIPASVAAGSYHLVATVDPGDQVAESDETNNTLVGPTVNVVGPLPTRSNNMVVTSLSYPDAIKESSTFLVNVGVYAGFPFYDTRAGLLKFSLSTDDVAGNADDIDLAVMEPAEWADLFDVAQVTPGSFTMQERLAVPAFIPVGNYHLVAQFTTAPHVSLQTPVVGHSMDVGAADPIAPVTPAPGVTELSVTTPTVGEDPVDFSDLNMHTGGGTVVASLADGTYMRLSFYLSRDRTLSWDDKLIETTTRRSRYFPPDMTLPVQTGFGSSYLRFPDTLDGVWYPIAVVDAENVVHESNESDNIAVGAPIVFAAGRKVRPAFPDAETDPVAAAPTPVFVTRPEATPVTPAMRASLRAGQKVARVGAPASAAMTFANSTSHAIKRTYDVVLYLSSDATLSADDTPFSKQRIAVSVSGHGSASRVLRYAVPRHASLGTQYLIAVAKVPGKAGAGVAAVTGVTRLEAAARISVARPEPTVSPWTKPGRLKAQSVLR